MLTLPPSVRIFLATEPVNLHHSFDRLAGRVRATLGHNPLSGHLFVFFNAARTHVKILVFDRSGYALWYKRLEQGTFQRLSVAEGQSHLEVDPTALTLLLDGIPLDTPRRRRFARPSSS